MPAGKKARRTKKRNLRQPTPTRAAALPPPQAGEGWGGGRCGADLMQRREGRRDHEHVLLADKLAARRRRPGAGLLRLGADAETLARVLVGPDMDPLVEPAELGRAAKRQRRQLGAALDPLRPLLDDGRQ